MRQRAAARHVYILWGVLLTSHPGAADPPRASPHTADPAPARAVKLPSIQIETGTIELPRLGMLANRISTDLSLSAQGLRGRYTIDALRNPNWPAALEPLTVAGTFHRDTRGLGVAGHARSGDSVLARWRVDQAARSAYPSVDIMVDAPAPALWEPVKVVLGSAWAAVNVRSGHVRGRVLRDGDGDGDTAPQGIGDVIAERITGNYDEMRFAGAEISVHLADALRPVMDYRINIATITLANGVIVEDFHSRGHQDGPKITLDETRMRTLGGAILLPTTTLDVNQPPLAAVLQIEGVELNRLLLLLEQEGLDGSGALSGTIPLRFYPDRVVVENAMLRNTTAGTLRYDPLAANMSEQLDNIALKALQDFRYRVLQMELNYDPEGNYVIKTRLEGHNPAIYDGHPIAFNLNITGTLPGLLRSSLLSGDFSGNVLKSIRNNP